MEGADDIRGRRIEPDEGMLLRRLRLAALADAPSAFWQTLAEASARPAEEWDARARAGTRATRATVTVPASGDVIATDITGAPVG
ncbi:MULTISPECIES: hypothetical protein [unclassified Frankia]